MKLTAGEVVSHLGGRLTFGSAETRIESVSIDSRTVERGDLFFAIVGPRFDGHRFVRQALERGAVGVVVSKPRTVGEGGERGIEIRVEDTTLALEKNCGGLGAARRSRRPRRSSATTCSWSPVAAHRSDPSLSCGPAPAVT